MPATTGWPWNMIICWRQCDGYSRKMRQNIGSPYRLKRYDAIVSQDSFTKDALDEMKQNCKDLIKKVKDELNEIKSEVNSW